MNWHVLITLTASAPGHTYNYTSSMVLPRHYGQGDSEFFYFALARAKADAASKGAIPAGTEASVLFYRAVPNDYRPSHDRH